MITHSDTNELFATISSMGRFMQPQRCMQLTVVLTTAGLDPQAAVDMPPYYIADGTSDSAVFLEDGMDENCMQVFLDQMVVLIDVPWDIYQNSFNLH